jgi:putative acetyltransferase
MALLLLSRTCKVVRIAAESRGFRRLSAPIPGNKVAAIFSAPIKESAARRKTRMALVRPEQPGDVAAIHAVHVASFPTDAEARMVSLLREAGHLLVSLVAEADGAVVGHVAFSPVSAATGAVGAGLAPVGVLASHRRQGIAARLIEAGLTACRSAGFAWAVVLGEPAYYSRFGFRPASAFGLSDEYGGGPAFQVIELVPGGLPSGAGLVRYASEFASVG